MKSIFFILVFSLLANYSNSQILKIIEDASFLSYYQKNKNDTNLLMQVNYAFLNNYNLWAGNNTLQDTIKFRLNQFGNSDTIIPKIPFGVTTFFNNVQLYWQSNYLNEVAQFQIYRFNKKFIKIGQMVAIQNQSHYNFIDTSVGLNSQDKIEYILKIVNKDSSIVFSDLITILFFDRKREEKSIMCWPNPAKNELHYLINESQFSKPESAEIISIYGQVLNKITLKEISGKIDLSNLNNGIYFLKIYELSGPKIIRIVISK